jgi:hypothetical protein
MIKLTERRTDECRRGHYFLFGALGGGGNKGIAPPLLFAAPPVPSRSEDELEAELAPDPALPGMAIEKVCPSFRL